MTVLCVNNLAKDIHFSKFEERTVTTQPTM